MATFLELVKDTRQIVGMQGTGPSTTVSQLGVEGVLVKTVQNAYVEIQNMREEWPWLEVPHSFATQAGKDTYSTLDMLTVIPLKSYQLKSFRITNSNNKVTYLKHLERNVLEARYLNDDQQKLPTQYTIDPPTNSVILKTTPDGVYTVDFRYQRQPEILSVDTQIPLLPLAFHNLISYRAAAKMAVDLGTQELQREYAIEYAKMLGQLMRLGLPKKRMNTSPLV